VVALEVVLDGDLPVARELELAASAEPEPLDLDAAISNELRHGPEEPFERGGLRVRVDEHEGTPGRDCEDVERDVIHVDLAGPRRRAKATVELVRPRVVRTLQRGAVAAALRHDRAAVA